MDIQTTKVNGRFFSVVRDGAPVVHITGKYLTRQMAEAAAKCWVAFHGEGDMIKDSDKFYSHQQVTGTQIEMTADQVRARIADALKHGCQVDERQGNGCRYIEIHNGKGSAYGQYFRKAA